MIRSAIFDADGTLIDSMPIWHDVGARYLKSIGVDNLPDNLAEHYFNMGLREAATDMKAMFHLSQSVDTIKQGFMDIVVNFYRNECPMKPGAKEFLLELHRRRVPFVLATANDATMARYALDHNGVLSLFQDTISCEDFDTTKKEPLIYQKAAELLGTAPEETAVFEDILLAVDTAHSAGFYTVAVEDSASAKDKPAIQRTADCYVSDYSQLDPGRFTR